MDGDRDLASPAYLVLDLDGTLADSAEGIVRSFRVTLEELGRPFDETVVRTLIGPPLGESFARLGVPDDELDDAVRRYRAHYDLVGVSMSRPYPGVARTIDALARGGRRLAVATSKRVDFAQRMLVDFALLNRFEVVAGASLDGRLNTKDEILDEVLALMGEPEPREGWMVGDRHYDVAAAHRRGLVAVGALWGYGSLDELVAAGARILLHQPGDLVTAALGAVPGAGA